MESFHEWESSSYSCDQQESSPSLAMYIVRKDDHKIYTVTIKRGYKREDVARVLDNPSLVDSGFQGILEKNKLAPGKYQMILLQIDPHSGVISCAGEPHRVVNGISMML